MSWKITAQRWPLPALAFSGVLFVATAALSMAGCGGGGGSSTGGGGQSSSGGNAGGTGGNAGCTTPADCPGMDTECQKRTCSAGVCGTDNTAAGTPTANQVPGDCKVVSCDGNGASASQNDDTDILDDGNDCTVDSCDAGSPKNTPLPSGQPCGSGGNVCDGMGACVECVDGKGCPSGVCDANKCAAPACVDAVKNGDETDVDCGGASCAPCADGLACLVAADCQSVVCTGMVCQVPVCSDAVKNGDETDIDCGGSCAPCGPGKGCGVDGDCVGGQCSGTLCVANCLDKTKNNNETDIDCGGPDCGGCDTGKACVVPNDCQSSNCVGNVCLAPVCGDAIVNGTEICDDGNVMAGDGCAADCKVEPGYGCMGSPSFCLPVCGDGLIKGGEECDDGNFFDGDGCSATCGIEPGYGCVGVPSLCKAICGDGQVYGDETCDDGNVVSNDGCSSACLAEAGYSCAGQPSVCVTICGDGLIKGAETCDDGNTANGDGCTSQCTVQPGYGCAGQPSMCVPVVCGDNVVGLGEQCDDGNVKSCDGCNSKCQLEPKVGPNLNLSIPDDGYNGTLASMTCVDLPVTAAGDSLVDSLCVQVGMTHTWIGDLTVKVVSPTSTVVTVMSRPGGVEATDDGVDSPVGDSSNMDKAYPVTFVDAGAKSAELMGNTITDAQIVCKDDLACVYDPAAGAAIPGKFAAFNNQNAVGTWKVCVGDSGALDVGAIDFVRLGVVQ